METLSSIKKTVIASCGVKKERRRKSKEDYLRKTFERGILREKYFNLFALSEHV